MNLLSPIRIFVRLLAVFIVLPVHECAHAYAAHLMGDDTARNGGRMSLNPLVHLDLIGSVALVLTGFGYAKPVPINTYNFRNRKSGMALSAAAGPISNIILAFVALIVYKLLLRFAIATPYVATVLNVLSILIGVSVTLGVFNLIPVPPLDGSRILLFFLPEKYYFMIMQYERYIMLVVILLAYTGALGLIIEPVSDVIIWLLDLLTSFI